MADRPAGWRPWLTLVASLLLLNASLTFENVWPTPRIRWGNAISIELVCCVLLLTLWTRPPVLLTRILLPALWVVLVAGHYLDVTGAGLYGRDFNLYWDSQHLGNVTAMLARAAPWWLLAAVAFTVVFATAGAFVLARTALGGIAGAVARPRPRLTSMAIAGVLLAAFAAQEIAGSGPVAFAAPVTPAYARQARYVLALAGPRAGLSPLGPSPVFESQMKGLGRSDVLLVFLESYGEVAFDTPRIADGLAASRRALENAIRESERQVVSAYVDSPTFGASSWLAHLSLLSGIEVRDQYVYTALMASGRETMLSRAELQGYRTVGLLPGMRQAWPEGAFYGFDAIYGHDALDYQGPSFGWWEIPDQYALAKLDALERRRTPRAPVFVVFPTSTTHAPFGPVAPYQPDWPRVLTAQPYDEEQLRRSFGAAPDLTNLTPSYVRAMAYEYDTFAGYFRTVPDDPLVVLIGDHQPPAAVSGAGASWRVPVHVVSRRRPVLDRLLEAGFHPGLTPARPSVGPMHTLASLLMDAFDATGLVSETR
jgi:hypothetical protein